MLTDIKYIGSELDDRGYEATICAEHNRREVADYVYQLEELECPVCLARHDRERLEYQAYREMVAGLGHPSICLCALCAPAEDEYDRLEAEQAARRFLGEIFSPNFCNHTRSDGWGCWDEERCLNARCRYERENPPF